jgi:hypothetical protein
MSTAANKASIRQQSVERTAARIRAFLAKVRGLRGCQLECAEHWQYARSLIERIAESADQNEDDYATPPLRLSADDCACVLQFLAQIEPLEPGSWWVERHGEPSHLVGYQMILFVLQESVLKLGRRR